MWQAQGGDKKPKLGMSAVGKKRRRTQHRRSIRMKRVEAQLKTLTQRGTPVSEDSAPIRLILNDLSPKGVGLYSSSQVAPGLEILISMTDPRRIDLHGRVVWCHKFNLDHKIISKNGHYDYRMGVEFVFENAEEAKTVESFIKEMMATHVYSPNDPAINAAESAAPTEDAAPAKTAEAAPAADTPSDS